MKGILSWVRNFATAISFLLFIATATLLVRSFCVTELLQIFRENQFNPVTDREESYQFSMGLGGLSLERGKLQRGYNNLYTASVIRKQSGYSYDNHYHVNWIYTPREYGGLIRGPRSIQFMGFRWRRIGPPLPKDTFSGGFDLTIPLFVPLLLFAYLPFAALRNRIIRARRVKSTYCAKCGYDLRATPLRCPECGTIPSNNAAIPN